MNEEMMQNPRLVLQPCQIDQFWQHGYLHIRGVFTPSEVANLRSRVLNAEEERLRSGCQTGDILSNPSLADYILDDRILGAAKQILGGIPTYFGFSSYTVYPVDSPPGGLHKDNSDRLDFSGPDWRGRYPLIRFGLYLQDHRKAAGGLALRAGSHHRVSKNPRTEYIIDNVVGVLTGRTRYLHTQIGDLLVWNLRTTHAGPCYYVRMLPWIPVTNFGQLYRHFPGWLVPRPEQPRAAIFVTYALQGAHLDRHIKSELRRASSVQMWNNSRYTPELLATMSGKPIEIMDLSKEVDRLKLSGVRIGHHKDWQPLEY